MERLKVKDFLAIKEADFNVKKFNVIIGKQATGKSTLTRLIHFLRESLKGCLDSAALLGVLNYGNSNFEKIFIDNLYSYFPGYLWENQKFNINYKLKDVEVKISNDNSKIQITVNENFEELLSIIKEFDEERMAKKDFFLFSRSDLIRWYLNSKNELKDSFYKIYVEENVYIPSGRSFFPTLRANTYALNYIPELKKLNLDPTLRQFGMLYEKGIYSFDKVISKYKAEYSDFLKDLNNICGGNLISHSDNVFIELENGVKIKIEDVSSGYQEVIPALMVLLTHSLEKEINDLFTIEEPEAHLFPETQRDVIFFISKVCNTFNKSVIITTHSPYILSAFNILLLANDIMNEKNKEKIEKIIGRNTAIKFEDIAAYTIEDGILKSFLNHETKLLDTNIIDKATEAFEDLFDKLNEIGLEG
jgi:AAA15 family ATPase/GTPase